MSIIVDSLLYIFVYLEVIIIPGLVRPWGCTVHGYGRVTTVGDGPLLVLVNVTFLWAWSLAWLLHDEE